MNKYSGASPVILVPSEGPYPDAVVIGETTPLNLAAIKSRNRTVAFYLRQATAMRRLGLRLPKERVVPVIPPTKGGVVLSGSQIGLNTAPTLAAIKITHNPRRHGESAAQYMREPGCYMVLEPNRQKEIAYVCGLERGSVVLVTDSSKAPGGAKVAGVALYLGCDHRADGSLEVDCQPLTAFSVPLQSAAGRRPVRLHSPQSAFGNDFSGQPLVTPCTASDLVGLHDAFGWPQRVLAGDSDERLDGLFSWAQTVDHAAVFDRWTSQAARGSAVTPRRIVTGGASVLTGRTGETLVAHWLRRTWPSATIQDVSRQTRDGLGCDLLVRVGWRERLLVEVKSTTERVRDPRAWARTGAHFSMSQEQAAERSLQRGQTPWVAAVVSEVLTAPAITLLSATDVFPHLALRLGDEPKAA